MAKKYTVASDLRADRRAGIKPGSARDVALDRKRGVLTPAMKRMHKAAQKKRG